MGSTTFYRWRDGDWTKDPRPTQVDAFCAALDIPITAAYRALGWGTDGKPPAPETAFDPELRAVQRRLMDPNVSDEQKRTIRQMLRLIVGQDTGTGRKAAGD
jgi:hypothetical protein